MEARLVQDAAGLYVLLHENGREVARSKSLPTLREWAKEADYKIVEDPA